MELPKSSEHNYFTFLRKKKKKNKKGKKNPNRNQTPQSIKLLTPLFLFF